MKCECLVDGRQCKKNAYIYIPTYLEFDGGKKIKQGRTAHLCRQHYKNYIKYKKEHKRKPVIHHGFLGGWNKWEYGDVVTCEEFIEWDNVTKLHCPQFWAIYGEAQTMGGNDERI